MMMGLWNGELKKEFNMPEWAYGFLCTTNTGGGLLAMKSRQ